MHASSIIVCHQIGRGTRAAGFVTISCERGTSGCSALPRDIWRVLLILEAHERERSPLWPRNSGTSPDAARIALKVSPSVLLTREELVLTDRKPNHPKGTVAPTRSELPILHSNAKGNWDVLGGKNLPRGMQAWRRTYRLAAGQGARKRRHRQRGKSAGR